MTPPAARRILMVSHRADSTGAPRCLAVLAAGLTARPGWTPAVVVPEEGPLCRLLPAEVTVHVLDRAGLAHVGMRTVAAMGPLSLLRFGAVQARYVRRLRRLVRDRADIVHVNSVEEPFAAVAARLARRPLVWHVHETLPDAAWARGVARLVFGLSDCVVAVSNVVRRRLCALAGRPDTACRVVYNGIDVERFRPDADGGTALRRRLGVTAGQLVVALVGTIAEHKGQLELLDAVETLPARLRETVVVVFAGTAGQQAYAERFLQRLRAPGLAGRAHYLGHVDDPRAVYAAADLVVSTSRVDSFPWSVLEAMAAQRAVIATSNTGAAEMIENGRTGWLVPLEGAALNATLAVALTDADARERVAAAARTHVGVHFTERRYIDGFCELYDGLAGGR